MQDDVFRIGAAQLRDVRLYLGAGRLGDFFVDDLQPEGRRRRLAVRDRIAAELGADVVKVNYPDSNDDGTIGPVADAPAPYNKMTWTLEEALAKILESAGRTMVIMSGGSRVSDELLLERVDASLKAGATGFIFGRNIWQRPHADAATVVGRIKDRMRNYAKELGA